MLFIALIACAFAKDIVCDGDCESCPIADMDCDGDCEDCPCCDNCDESEAN